MNFRNNSNTLFIILCFVLASSLGTALSVSAQNERTITEELMEYCARASNAREMGLCTGFLYERADRELNLVWQQVISQLSSNERERLIDEELAWIEERDATCDRETVGHRGGNAYRSFVRSCLTRITRERTAILREYLR
jgi:uncharacterized protein YecT (DUF1311 family)